MGLGDGLCSLGQAVVERVRILVFVFWFGHGGRDGGRAGRGWSLVSFENMDACSVHIRGSFGFLAVFYLDIGAGYPIGRRGILPSPSRHCGRKRGAQLYSAAPAFPPSTTRPHAIYKYIGRGPLLMERTNGNLNWMIEMSRVVCSGSDYMLIKTVRAVCSYRDWMTGRITPLVVF